MLVVSVDRSVRFRGSLDGLVGRVFSRVPSQSPIGKGSPCERLSHVFPAGKSNVIVRSFRLCKPLCKAY